MRIPKSIVFVASVLLVGCGAFQKLGTRAPQGEASASPVDNVREGFPRPVYRLETLPPTLVPPCSEELKLCIRGVDSAVCVKLPDAEDCDFRGLIEPNPELEYLGWRDSWEWAVVGPDDRTIIFGYTLGGEGCNEIYDFKIVEKADAVIASLLIGLDPEYPRSEDGKISCHAIARLVATSLTLPSPLGDRKLLDGTKDPTPESTKTDEAPAHTVTIS